VNGRRAPSAEATAHHSDPAAPGTLGAPRSALPSYDLARLRELEFPWAARGEAVYLNNASTGPLPERTVRAVGEFTRLRATPYRLGEELQFATVARSRELCARLVAARPESIALMVNTSYGINLAARALPLPAGSAVLTFDREFPANVYPWMALAAERGVRLERVACDGALPDEEALARRLARGGVSAVAVSWVSFATGYRVSLARLGALCREHGAYFVVDAMQGVGALQLDAPACNIDVLACGGQKWLLAPWGTGFVYVREGLVGELAPSAVGWMSVRGSDDFSRMCDYDFTYRDDARRFEVVTLPYQEFAGLNASLELLFELGPEAVTRHVTALADRIVAWAAGRDDVRLVTPADPARRAGIVAVAPRDPQGAAARLRAAGVAYSLREGAIRLSPHCYNTADEVDAALAALG
jgi:selenocysteine lyase/cysteine desulfurase